MINYFFSIIALLLFVPLFILTMIIGILLSYITHSRNFYSLFTHNSCKLLMLSCFQRFNVLGNVPKKENGPYIFMFNHASMFDAFMLGGSIPFYINAIGWEGIFKWPLWGFFAKRYGAYSITHDNTDSAIKTLEAAEKILLQDGDSMILSPEGQRTITGELGEFKKGGFHYVKNTNIASIVPVGLKGAFEANKRTSWKINPGNLTVVFGEPILPLDYKELSVEELRNLTKKRISELLV